MVRRFVVGVCLWAGTLLASGCQREAQTPSIQGIPFEEALKVVDRNATDWLQIPSVQGIGLSLDGLVVELDSFGVEVPQSVEWLRVTIRSGGNILSTPLQTKFLPPPSEVIVLRPGGGREVAQQCPADLAEQEVQGWRFCLDPHAPNTPTIPPLWRPPIVGIPYDEAFRIWKRHAAELMRISSVAGVILSASGIIVEVENLDITIPHNVEGIPVNLRKFSRPRLLTVAMRG
jgi:hypothetical protein